MMTIPSQFRLVSLYVSLSQIWFSVAHEWLWFFFFCQRFKINLFFLFFFGAFVYLHGSGEKKKQPKHTNNKTSQDKQCVTTQIKLSTTSARHLLHAVSWTVLYPPLSPSIPLGGPTRRDVDVSVRLASVCGMWVKRWNSDRIQDIWVCGTSLAAGTVLCFVLRY